MVLLCNGVARRFCAAMRCCRAILLAVLSAAAIASAAGADTQSTEPADKVQSMLADSGFQEALHKSKGVNPKAVNPKCTPIAYLVLDHETLEWSLYHSKPPKPVNADMPVSVTKDNLGIVTGPDGNPHVLRSAREKLVLVVVNTNPFLYSYTGTVSPPQESLDAAAMRTALGAIGNAIASLPQEITLYGRNLTKDELGELSVKIPKDLQNLVETRERVQLAVQALETGVGDISNVPSPDKVVEIVEAGLYALRTLEAFAKSPKLPLFCYQTWLPLLRLTDLHDIKNEDLAVARTEMIEALHTIEVRKEYECQCAAEANKAFEILDDLLKADAPNRPKILIDRVQKASEAWRALVLSAKQDFLVAAAQLKAFIRLGRTQTLCPETGDYTAWFLSGNFAVVVPPFPDQNWLMDNPGTISVKSEESMCPDCVRLKRVDVEKKFLLASRRQGFLGVGFGVIVTSIKDPTFSAVAIDTNTTQIVRTSEESRSGTIVAMLFLRLRPLCSRAAQPAKLEPGVELGAGLDPKKLGLYLGPSLEIRRYVRIGLGTTLQWINRLADGLKFATYGTNGQPPDTGTHVSGTGGFQTFKKKKLGWYFGVSFAFDALPLFSPSK